jgi:hypothetical protein
MSTELPLQFCVKARHQGRDGYFLMRWSQGPNDPNGRAVHILKPSYHHDRFYNVSRRLGTDPVTPVNRILVRKGHGTVNREISWYLRQEVLTYQGIRYPVLQCTPSTALPSTNNHSFIPVLDPAPAVAPAPAPAVAPAPVPAVAPVAPAPLQRHYKIKTIPQHIVLALLRDAAINEMTCPITSDDIDVTNGAVTSCFHLFERDAIARWLAMPYSKDECPVCKQPCNSYALDRDEPPPLDTTIT